MNQRGGQHKASSLSTKNCGLKISECHEAQTWGQGVMQILPELQNSEKITVVSEIKFYQIQTMHPTFQKQPAATCLSAPLSQGGTAGSSCDSEQGRKEYGDGEWIGHIYLRAGQGGRGSGGSGDAQFWLHGHLLQTTQSKTRGVKQWSTGTAYVPVILSCLMSKIRA